MAMLHILQRIFPRKDFPACMQADIQEYPSILFWNQLFKTKAENYLLI